jgi:hypothetical protein
VTISDVRMPFQKGGGTDWPIRILRLPSPPRLTYHWHGIWGLKLSPLYCIVVVQTYFKHWPSEYELFTKIILSYSLKKI